MKTIPSLFPAILLATGLLHLPLGATLLVYESFTGYNEGALATQTANSTGLTGDWAHRGHDSTAVTGTGLTFGSLVTSGGAATASQASGRVSVAGVALDLASPVTGTLYSSMLFNFDSVGNNSQNLASMRVSDNSGIQNNNRLATWPLSQGETTYNPGVSYDSSSVPAGQSLSIGETYMAISVFDNVGTELGTGDGVARSYVLNLAQFEDFVANGRNQANLAGRGIGGGANQVAAFSEEILNSGTYDFANGDYLGLSTFSDGGTVTVTYDELRWATDLNSVTVIPEPNTLVLMGLSLTALVLFRIRGLSFRRVGVRGK